MKHERILLFCSTPLRELGGTQIVALGVGNHLRSCNLDVIEAWPDCEEAPRRVPIRLSSDLAGGAFAGLRTLANATRDGFGLLRRIARIRPTCVNIHFIRGEALYFVLLKHLFGFRLVLSFHGGDLPPRNAQLKWVLPYYFKMADKITVVSRPLKEAVKEFGGPDDAILIRNGVDLDFWSPTDHPVPRDIQPLVVAVGRLEAVKGFDILVEALADDALSGVRLVIAGEGSQKEALEQRAARLGVADRVEFAGRLGPEELRALYRRASVFALSSRDEGMPLALIEAMACGLPVVAASVGAVPDVVKEPFGFVVPPEDPGRLAEALAKSMAPGLSPGARHAARAHSERFSAAASYAAYREALRG
jgi:glycosyltransferase involved in cell wall biosynthesis